MKWRIVIALLPLALHAQALDTVVRLSSWPEFMLYVPAGNKLYVKVNARDSLGRQIASLHVLDCSTWTTKKVYDLGFNDGADGAVWNWRRNKVYYGTIGGYGTLVIDNANDSATKWIGPMAALTPAYDSRDDKIYTVSMMTVSVIDCATDSVIKVISQPYQLNGFTAWDSVNDRVYVGCAWNQYVTVIDCTTDSVIAVIAAGTSEPSAASFYYERNKVYIPAFWNGITAVIDTRLLSVLRQLPFTTENTDYQMPFVVNAEEDKCYAIKYPSTANGDTLFVLRASDDSITKELPTFGEGEAIALAPWSNRLYVVAETVPYAGGNLLQVVDCRTDSVVGWYRFGLLAMCMTGNPLSHELYVSDWWDSAIYVFKDTIVGAVAEQPTALEARLSMSVWPNVINPGAPLNVTLEAAGSMLGRPGSLRLFDCSGRLIAQQKVVLDRPKTAISWTPSETPLAAGIYVVAADPGRMRQKVIVR
jgi:DNA-binding beta-propeller fold protein YncE